MSGNTVSLIIGILCLLLLGGLIYRHTQAVQRERDLTDRVADAEFRLGEASDQVEQTRETNTVLQTRLSTYETEMELLREESLSLSNRLEEVTLQRDEARKEIQVARKDVEDRDRQILDLNRSRDELSRELSTLNDSITDLQTRIESSRRVMDQNEGERKFLLETLARLQGEKREIESRFDDLQALRERIGELQRESTVRSRYRWVGRNAGHRKGAELLVRGFRRPPTDTDYTLDVEIRQSGEVSAAEPPPVESPPGE